MSAIGSYSEKPYLRAMARTTSNLRVSRSFPSGTMPPSAMLSARSGTMLSMSTFTMRPRPLQCGQ